MLKNIILGLVVPLVLVAVGVGVFVGMRKAEPQKVAALGTDPAALLSLMPSAKVQVVRALAEKSETLDIHVNGTVVPYREIDLAAEAAGRIIEKDPLVRSGNFVTKGQVLLRIDPRDYELNVESLTRRRDQELASLEELNQDIENAKRLIEVTDEEYALADQEVKRMESLGLNFTSAAELDQARRARLASANQRITLQNQIRSLEAKIARLELAAKLAETEIEQAKLDLDRTIVRAPVSGRIVSESVEVDSYVQRGTPLLTVEDTEKVEVAVNLRMDQLYWVLDQANLSADQLVNAAQASNYELPQLPVHIYFNLAGRESIKYEWEGVLDRYDGAGLDPQSRTIPVRVLVDSPHNYRINGEPAHESARSGPPTLVRGMFVEVDIKTRPATQLLLVPKLGIKPATGTSRIWKFEPTDKAFAAVQEKHASLIKPDSDAVETPSEQQADEQSDTADSGDKASRKQSLDPAKWQPGFLKVLDGIQVVGAFESDHQKAGDSPDSEYWICDVNGNPLAPGDFVVVTPLPGVQEDGNDTIRVPKAQPEGSLTVVPQ